jgi:sensor histidine kinase YesM
LKFTIKNSKDEDQNTVNQGIGLKNVKRQLELIYGENYSLEIESESKVFFVKLTIQLSPHEE